MRFRRDRPGADPCRPRCAEIRRLRGEIEAKSRPSEPRYLNERTSAGAGCVPGGRLRDAPTRSSMMDGMRPPALESPARR